MIERVHDNRNFYVKEREFEGILGENFFSKKFSPNPFQKTLNWEK